MKHLTITLLLMALPFNAYAELYQWVDDHGTVNYTNDPNNLPESEHIPVAPVSKPFPSEQKKNHDESAKIFINETVENIKKLSLRIEKGLKSVDVYQEKNRSVSKYVIISYINSMSNEIRNLKGTYTSGSLDEAAKKALLVQLDSFEKKYSEYNEIVNDFDTISVKNFINTMEIDYKTARIVDASNNPISYSSYISSGAVNTGNNKSAYVITEENIIFTFSATISNTGSKADVTIELNGVNYRGGKVASHVINTNIGSGIQKEIGDRIVLSKAAATGLSTWEIADVKITRHRK